MFRPEWRHSFRATKKIYLYMKKKKIHKQFGQILFKFGYFINVYNSRFMIVSFSSFEFSRLSSSGWKSPPFWLYNEIQIINSNLKNLALIKHKSYTRSTTRVQQIIWKKSIENSRISIWIAEPLHMQKLMSKNFWILPPLFCDAGERGRDTEMLGK